MFPDPSYRPNETRDMRFGLQSYALSFSAWQIFLNLVDYERPAPPALPDLVDLGHQDAVEGRRRRCRPG